MNALGSRPQGLPDSVFIHPLALVESAEIGERTKIWPFTHVMKDAKIGADSNICEHVFIEGGAVIGERVTVKNGVSIWDLVTIKDEVFVGPGAVFTNHPRPRAFIRGIRSAWEPIIVHRGATIGAGAVIVCGVELGEYCFVAAGSVVTKSVPPYALVAGNPAKFKRYVCKCLQKRFESDDHRQTCPNCGVSLDDLSLGSNTNPT